MHHMLFILYSALSIAQVDAHTFAKPNCIIPSSDSHNIVSSPSIRGTVDILWSCLATIISCTYTVLHMNIPEQRDDQDRNRGWKGDLKWWWRGIKSSIKWTLITALAPEFYTGVAIRERIGAVQLLRELKKLPTQHHPPRGWTLAYAFFIRMGGFRVPIQGTADDRPSVVVLKGETFVALLAEQAKAADKERQWPGVILPTEAEILDRSKADRFAKSITVLQVFYFCLSCFVRFGRHLPVTQLELGTLGFATCSLVTYWALFNKPRAVNSMITLAILDLQQIPSAAKTIKDNGPLRKVAVNDDSKWGVGTWLPALILANVLGSIHIAGWNFAFPTQIDRWIWRSCAVASAASPLAWIVLATPLLLVSWNEVSDTFTKVAIYSGLGETAFLVIVYSIARVLLMALMVRCLFYLPIEAFSTTWTTNIPHLG